jgi:hypothetical protein
LRFKDGSINWNVNFYRIDSQKAERSTWSSVPRNFGIIALAFTRQLIWDAPLRKPGSNIALIPFALGNYNQNFTEKEKAVTKANFGGDAKIAVGPALNLDLTFNPDFSQVEVDQQVTNLDRFEIFFPERRQFFLENADLFANFGHRDIRPFFSRRIGIAIDTSTGQNIQNTIYAGARLSGKINNNLRVGLLSMQAAEDEEISLPSLNYTVAALQQKVFSRSNIGMIYINKQPFLNENIKNYNGDLKAYNRTLGFDYNLASKDGKWSGKLFYHHIFDNNKLDKSFATSAEINRNTLKWDLYFTAQQVGENYNPRLRPFGTICIPIQKRSIGMVPV